jgi:hypothetical protein
VHLEDARDYIARILDPRVPRAVIAAGRGGGAAGVSADTFDFDNDPFQQPPTDCWQDLVLPSR